MSGLRQNILGGTVFDDPASLKNDGIGAKRRHDFPEMCKFLDFWQAFLDGPLHSVRYSHQHLLGPNEWRRVYGEFKLH